MNIDTIMNPGSGASLDQKKAALDLTIAVVKALSVLPAGEGIPSGHLYAMLLGKFTDVGAYESFIGMLERVGFVRRVGLMIHYAGAR